MYNSITNFNEFGVGKIRNKIKSFIEERKNIADLVLGLQEDIFELGRNILAEVIEDIDNHYRNSSERKKQWEIIRKDTNSILTSFGNVEYERTYFKSKKDGLSKYLADETVGIDPHERMSADVEINVIEEAIESSYRKGGEKASFVDEVSKQTVMSKIHKIEVIEPELEVKNRKKIKILYVEADEDHVSLQKIKREKTQDPWKKNTYISKLVYVHEGIDAEKSTNKRKVLKNVRYFADAETTEDLWIKVSTYIYNNYDQDYLETVYLSGDGAPWIKQGLKWILKSKFVLDNHHQNKYIKVATAHLQDDDDYEEELREAIETADKEMLKVVFKRIVERTTVDTKRAAVVESYKYLINNWKGIAIKVEKSYEIVGCSAEGHVSHILSNRLSSRPKGWSKNGVKQMSKLIIYSKNGGKIYDLVMAQKIKEKREKNLQIQEGLIKSLRKASNGYDTITLPAIERGQKSSLYCSLKAIIGM